MGRSFRGILDGEKKREEMMDRERIKAQRRAERMVIVRGGFLAVM